MTTTFKPEDTRPFNIEHAKAGAPVCQRSGYPATILKFDVKGEFPIAGILVIDHDEEIVAWRFDGSFYDKGEDDLYDVGLVMKPLAYLQGRPVHFGDELIADGVVLVEAFPELDFDSVNLAWPTPKIVEDEAKPEPEIVYAEPIPDRVIDSLIPSGLHVHEKAYPLLYEFAQNINNEAFARFPRATNPNTVTLTKSDIQHVVWAYMQLAGSRFGLDSTVAHMTALREIAVKHGGLVEGNGKAPEPVLSLKPLRDYQQAAIDAMNQSFVDAILPGHEVTMVAGTGNSGEVIDDEPKASIDFIDTILPKDFPVKFSEPVEPVVVDTSKAPPVAIPFKNYLSQQIAQQAETIRKLTEANTALEDLVRAHIEDNAKLTAMHNDQIAETGRWMAEANKLCDEVKALNSKVSAELPVNYIEWTGGDCPVSPANVVKVILRNGATWQGMADGVNWSHTDSRVNWSDHIVGYKVAK